MIQRHAALKAILSLIVVTLISITGAQATENEAEPVQRYYQSVSFASTPLFRQSLHQLLTQQRTVSRRSQWSALEKSGASALPDAVDLFYLQEPVPTAHRASGVNANEPDYWNREHIWPRSYGLKGHAAQHDLHNLVPADRTVNNSRQNKVFDNGGRPHKECRECRTNRDSWEPPDVVKGDVARISFYMAFRYNGESGGPDLTLSRQTFIPAKGQFGNLYALLGWHCADPVSNTEQRRNEAIYTLQQNRNPFVDHPDWVKWVFGGDC